jgi:alpha-glucosidase
VQDPWEKNVPGLGLGRDPVRTPMQWHGGRQAGFSKAEPWLPIGPDWRTVNVETQTADGRSILCLYRALIALRGAEPALSVGSYREAHVDEAVLAYWREADGRRLLVALNLTDATRSVELPRAAGGTILLSTQMDWAGKPAETTLRLRSDEGVIVALDA